MPLRGQTAPITCLAFHPHLPLIASGGQDRALRLWHVEEQAQKLMAPIEAVVLSADQSLLASGSVAGTLRLWHWQDQGQGLLSFARIPNQRLGEITSLAMPPRGRQIAAAYVSGLIQIWEPDPQVTEIGKN
ncbi:hypothetical protein D3A95_09330 [Thermosynechococcus sichuanensis E542]|uniref:Uncharacterized protein n=1 Tax=Thermosynechococcus sichuanensis E542 TaxID=2016101 RepID=A0A3B7MDM1_9CYAN|nr:hypothetical protein [Thermosynechococcus vestitus]AXY68743.1 hypothetical protein D3A95_09330 [Thermosynechococcus vestitus E542]